MTKTLIFHMIEIVNLLDSIALKDCFREFKYVLVVRMNPDLCKILPSELSDLTARTNYMIEIMITYLDLDKLDELDEYRTNVIYLFYNKKGYNQHILYTKENEDKVVIAGEYYCDDSNIPHEFDVFYNIKQYFQQEGIDYDFQHFFEWCEDNNRITDFYLSDLSITIHIHWNTDDIETLAMRHKYTLRKSCT